MYFALFPKIPGRRKSSVSIPGFRNDTFLVGDASPFNDSFRQSPSAVSVNGSKKTSADGVRDDVQLCELPNEIRNKRFQESEEAGLQDDVLDYDVSRIEARCEPSNALSEDIKVAEVSAVSVQNPYLGLEPFRETLLRTVFRRTAFPHHSSTVLRFRFAR